MSFPVDRNDITNLPSLTVVIADYVVAEDRLVLSATVATPAAADRLRIYATVLQYNYHWEDTGSIRMALEGPAGSLVQISDLRVTGLDLQTLHNGLSNFNDKIHAWREALDATTPSTIPTPKDEGRAPPLPPPAFASEPTEEKPSCHHPFPSRRRPAHSPTSSRASTAKTRLLAAPTPCAPRALGDHNRKTTMCSTSTSPGASANSNSGPTGMSRTRRCATTRKPMAPGRSKPR